MNAWTATAAATNKQKKTHEPGIFFPSVGRNVFFFVFFFGGGERITLSFVILVTAFQVAPCNSDNGLDYSAIEA